MPNFSCVLCVACFSCVLVVSRVSPARHAAAHGEGAAVQVACFRVDWHGRTTHLALELEPLPGDAASAAGRQPTFLRLPASRTDVGEAAAAAVNRHLLKLRGAVAVRDSDAWPPVTADLRACYSREAAIAQRAAIAVLCWAGDDGRWRSAPVPPPPTSAVTVTHASAEGERLRLTLAPGIGTGIVAVTYLYVYLAASVALNWVLPHLSAVASLAVAFTYLFAALGFLSSHATLEIGRADWKLTTRLGGLPWRGPKRGATADLLGAEVASTSPACTADASTRLALRTAHGPVWLPARLSVQEQLYAAWQINSYLARVVTGAAAAPGDTL